MRYVKIIRMVSQAIFMLAFFVMGSISNGSLAITLKSVALVVIAMVLCYFTRNIFKKSLGVGVHLVVTAFVVFLAETAFDLPTWEAVLIGIYGGISLFSMFIKSECNILERSGFFHVILLLLMLLVARVTARPYRVLIVIMGILFLVSYLFQLFMERRGKQVEFDVAHSVGDDKKIYSKIVLFYISVVFIIALVAGCISLTGMIPAVSRMTDKASVGIYSYLDGLKGNIHASDSIFGDTNYNGLNIVTLDEPEYELDPESILAIVVSVIGVIGGCVGGVYFIAQKLKNKKTHEEHTKERVVKINSKKTIKEVDETQPEDYSHRIAIRKIYRKAIRGRNKAKRMDLDCKTPFEQKEKRCDEGIDITTSFVKMYERARYSNASLNKEDVLQMKQESKAITYGK